MDTTQDYIQALLHNGRVIDARYFHKSTNKLADNASTNFLIVTGVEEFHAYADIKSIGTLEIYGFHSTTVSALGTEIPFRNRHHAVGGAIDYVHQVKAYLNPTITSDGEEMYSDMVPAGGSQGNVSTGAATKFEDGFILAPNALYLLRITNRSGAAMSAHVTITGHEQILKHQP